MAKKKEKNPNILSDDQFYRWKSEVDKLAKKRCEQRIEKLLLDICEKKIQLMEKDVLIAKRDYASLKVKVDSNSIENNAKKEYDEFRARFEVEIGQPLEGKCINEYTKEITKI